MSQGSTTADPPRAEWAPAEERAIRVLNALGVAVQRHRIYPPRSPLCTEAAADCKAALDEFWSAPSGDATDVGPAIQTSLEVRVTPEALYLDLKPLPATGPLSELAERLFRADIEELTLREGVTETELVRFCRHLAGWERRRDRHLQLSEILTELDITGVRARDTERLEVLDFDIVTSRHLEGLRSERRRRVRERDDAVDPKLHKAWARVDPDSSTEPIDMVDLAFLVDDQMDLAKMLFQLAEGDADGAGGTAALRESVTQLVHLYAGLSPEQADARFRELATSLMELEPEARRTLTRDVIVQDVLETGKSAALMRLLPDEEIVEAISTLADLEIGGQGLVRLALQRLDLPPQRLEAVLGPLLETVRKEMGEDDPDARTEVKLSADGDVFRDLREFAAFELAVGDETQRELDDIKARLAVIDGDRERLSCAAALVPHLRNPDRASEILRPLPAWLTSLMESDTNAAAGEIRSLRDTARRLEEIDPELCDTVNEVLRQVLSAEFICERAGSWAEAGGRSADPAFPLMEAFGIVAADAFVECLEAEERRPVRRAVLDYMCHHASFFAEHLEARVSDARWTVVRNVVRVFGFAGEGYEPILAKALDHLDKRVIREALMALSRVGSATAAEEIFSQLSGDETRRELAEDAMRRFPVEEGVRLTQRLLSRSDFYTDRPQVARSLICWFLADDPRGSEEFLRPLLRYRFRFWSPALAGLGWTAAAALRRTAK